MPLAVRSTKSTTSCKNSALGKKPRALFLNADLVFGLCRARVRDTLSSSGHFEGLTLCSRPLFMGHSEGFNKETRRISENATSVFGGMFALTLLWVILRILTKKSEESPKTQEAFSAVCLHQTLYSLKVTFSQVKSLARTNRGAIVFIAPRSFDSALLPRSG